MGYIDDFTAVSASIHGRVSSYGYTWTARPQSPLDNNGNPVISGTSAIEVTGGYARQDAPASTMNIATVDTGDPDEDFYCTFDQAGAPFSGAGLIARWSAAAWLICNLYVNPFGTVLIDLSEEVAGSVRTALLTEALGHTVVGAGLRLRLNGGTASVYTQAPGGGWTLRGDASTAINLGSSLHGIDTYYSAPDNSGWRINNLQTTDPDAGGWSVGVVRR